MRRMTITLRAYKPRDYAQLKKNLQNAKMYWDDMDSKKLLQRMMRKDPEAIIVAEDKRKVVGSVYFIDLGFTAMMWRLNVTPDYQKKGIGKKLIGEVKQRAKKRGFTQVHFTVHEEQKELIEWYQRNGAWKGSAYRWMGIDL